MEFLQKYIQKNDAVIKKFLTKNFHFIYKKYQSIYFSRKNFKEHDQFLGLYFI